MTEKKLKERIEHLEEMVNVLLKYKNGGLYLSGDGLKMYVKENNSTTVKVFDFLDQHKPSTASFNGETFDTCVEEYEK